MAYDDPELGRRPGAPMCHRWRSGWGCDLACNGHHAPSDDILNECHRFQRGKNCHTTPCYRLHVEPGSSARSSNAAPPPPGPPPGPPPNRAPPIQPAPDLLLAAVKGIIARAGEDRCRTAKRLLKKFHDDHTPDAELRGVFLTTVLFLTDIVNAAR